MKKIFKKLQIVASHLVGHWGRVSGPVELEFEEVLPEYTRILGECAPCFCLIVVCYFIFNFFHFCSYSHR